MSIALPIHNVPLTARRGCFKPCQWCGCDLATFVEAPEIEPAHHAARVVCKACGRQTAWASARAVRKAIRLIEARFLELVDSATWTSFKTAIGNFNRIWNQMSDGEREAATKRMEAKYGIQPSEPEGARP